MPVSPQSVTREDVEEAEGVDDALAEALALDVGVVDSAGVPLTLGVTLPLGVPVGVPVAVGVVAQ